mgnify:CR=1 FL=1|tara:strand:- start:34254 stop:34673 length:420 start_codon:yes stop_codon:yes gene_type:complete
MEVEVIDKFRVHISTYETDISAYLGANGEIYLSACGLLKMVAGLPIPRAQQVCRNYKIAELFDQIYIQDTEIDVLNIRNTKHHIRVFDVIEEYLKSQKGNKWVRLNAVEIDRAKALLGIEQAERTAEKEAVKILEGEDG